MDSRITGSGEIFDYYNNSYSQGTGLLDFEIVEYDENTHMAQVKIHLHGGIVVPAFCPTSGHNGPKTGIVHRPTVGMGGKGFFKSGKGAASTGSRFEILHYNYNTEVPPPQHPDAKNKPGARIEQMGRVNQVDGSTEPSTVKVYDPSTGGVSGVQMGPDKFRKESASDVRSVGQSVTRPESNLIDASSSVFSTIYKAENMLSLSGNPTDENIAEIARGFDVIGSAYKKAEKQSSEAATLLSEQAYAQAESYSLSKNSANLAQGIYDINSL